MAKYANLVRGYLITLFIDILEIEIHRSFDVVDHLMLKII